MTFMKKIFRRLERRPSGAEIVDAMTAPAGFGAPPQRMSIEALYQHAGKLGLVPGCIVDVGAAWGDFTRMATRLMPGTTVLLMEPLVEYDASLRRLLTEIPKTHLVQAAAADYVGQMTINVHGDLVGSSLMHEWDEPAEVNGKPRDVAVTTIDAEMAKLGHPENVWLKIDVQGAELKVLAGAEETLRRTALLVVETTLFNTFADGPVTGDVMAFMAARGFVLYDIAGFLYRPLDGALMQIDVAFVPKDSALRRHHAFATPEQRREFTAHLAARQNT
jgi:FkbM family methyltransferase